MKDNENQNVVYGYHFSDANEYKDAKREAETIEYIKANTDLNDLNKALKLYHRLVEKKTLNTIVGYGFLKELQEKIIQSGIIGNDKLPSIPIKKEEKKINGRVQLSNLEEGREKKFKTLAENYRIKLRNSRIINAFLVLIIAVMIIITLTSDRSLVVMPEEDTELVDQYAQWKEELDAREKAIEEREEAILRSE